MSFYCRVLQFYLDRSLPDLPDQPDLLAHPAQVGRVHEEDAGEDEGWLLSVIYNRASMKSELLILDASQVSAGPVARILLPQRVPFGFHGVWVNENEVG